MNPYKEISDNVMDYSKFVKTAGKGDPEEAELELFEATEKIFGDSGELQCMIFSY